MFNFDEAWVNDLSYNQKQWYIDGQRNSLASKSVIPRLSLIVAIDNHGKIYMTMTQANTNEDIM